MEVISLGKAVLGKKALLLKLINEKDPIANVLNIIGNVHYKAAKKSLSDASVSNNPNREIEYAINSLREAREAYIQQSQRKIFFIFTNNNERKKGNLGACNSSILIAVLYSCLNENRQCNLYLDYALEEFEQYSEATLDIAHRDQMLANTQMYSTDCVGDAQAKIAHERRELKELVNKYREQCLV